MDLPASATPHDISSVYEAHFEYVWNNLRRLGVEAADLEDAVHDVFVVAHRRRHEFRGTSSMRTWLFGIARRVARDHRRRHFRHRRRLDAVRNATPTSSPREPPQEQAASSALLRRFLDSLDEGKRSVFILSELEQMTGREVAVALQLNPNTVASRLRAARQAFDLYARGLRHADQLLVKRPPPIPEASRRRAWALVTAQLARPPTTGAVPASAAGATLGHAKAIGLTLALAAGGLGAIKLVANSTARSTTTPARPAAARAIEQPPELSLAATPRTTSEPPSSSVTSSMIAPSARRPSAPSGARASRRSNQPTTQRASAALRPLDDLAEHNRRLTAARAALDRAQARQAQQIAEDYLHRHPDGFYADEMQLARIQALSQQSKCEQARPAARSLSRRRSGTTLAALATMACPSPAPDPSGR
ncbi:MAG: sigma-70 family RNA polymerase sigma factor [Myxococcota bacterium]